MHRLMRLLGMLLLSGAMMLDWLSDRHSLPACHHAAITLTRAVERAYAGGTLTPVEYGGTAGTAEIAERVRSELTKIRSH